MRRLFIRTVAALIVLTTCARESRAIGWDKDDFVVTVGTGFITKIAVLDHDLTFKGYLDPDFGIVRGIDFDAAGNLVAAGDHNTPEVRVYSPSGVRIGGFTNTQVLVSPGQLDVAPNGDYLLAAGSMDSQPQTITGYALSPQGAIVHEYRAGGAFGISAIPGGRVWTGRSGMTGVDVFDQDTAQHLGFTPINGVAGINAITYDPSTNTALIATFQSNGVIETDLNGNALRTFTTPENAAIISATRGPDGDVFAAARTSDVNKIFRWHANGDYVSTTTLPPDVNPLNPAVIVWAGVVPEPTTSAITLLVVAACLCRRIRR